MKDLSDIGRPPDARFSLANERTFLAWNRTAIALIAGGLAAGQLLEFDWAVARLIVALPPVVLGGWLAYSSPRRWERYERAMRLDEPLPVGSGRAAAWAIAAFAIVIVAVVLLDGG